MKYLLDTHILFWSMSEESKLSGKRQGTVLCLLLGMNSIGLLSGLQAVGPIPAAFFYAWGVVRVSFMFFLGLCGNVNREGYMKEFPLCDHMRLLLKWS